MFIVHTHTQSHTLNHNTLNHKITQDDVLLAFQVGFDLIENEMQSFLLKVQALLNTMAPTPPTPTPPPVPTDTTPTPTDAGDAMDTEGASEGGDPATDATPSTTTTTQAAAQPKKEAGGAGTAGGNASAAGGNGSAAGGEPLSPEQQAAVQYHDRYGRLQRILSGEVPIALSMDFLFSHNHADLQVCSLWCVVGGVGVVCRCVVCGCVVCVWVCL